MAISEFPNNGIRFETIQSNIITVVQNVHDFLAGSALLVDAGLFILHNHNRLAFKYAISIII